MLRTFRNPAPLAALLVVALLAPAHAPRTQQLPDFGSPADSVLSKSREKMLGRSVILELRRAGAIVNDPQLNEYVGLLGASLASQANDGDFSFEFFMIDDDTINAFAMPGGVIGVNMGLLLATDNESELAAVIAHEVSHVTQRHIARAAYDQRRGSMVTLAATIAALLLGGAADSSGDAAMGAAMAAQAAGIQRQINFTRSNEYEADRIGMGVLARAGYDPTAMASFFEKLSRRESRATDIIPEMLRTHPTGSGRITEARSRARQLPRVNHVDSMAYGLAKARIRVLTARTPMEAMNYYRVRENSTDPADRYGRALLLMDRGLSDQAETIFRELSSEFPNVVAFRIGRAEALMADGLTAQAMRVYAEANVLSPRNIPLVTSYAEALLAAEDPAAAHKLLLDLLNNKPPTPAQIELIARAANAEGDTINAHHYMSEYYASIGDLRLAIAQLERALAIETINAVERARFNARLQEFEEYLAESER